jgi:hypothetical protein
MLRRVAKKNPINAANATAAFNKSNQAELLSIFYLQRARSPSDHSAQATTSTSTSQSGETRPATNTVVIAGRTPSSFASLHQSIHVLTPRQKEGHLHDVRKRHVRGSQNGRDVQQRLPALTAKVRGQVTFRSLADLALFNAVRVDAAVLLADWEGIMPS